MRLTHEIKHLRHLEVDIPQMETDKEGKIRGGFAAMATMDEEMYTSNIGCNYGCNMQCNDQCNTSCKAGCNSGCNYNCNEKCNTGCKSGCNVNCNTTAPTESKSSEQGQYGAAALFPSSFSLLF